MSSSKGTSNSNKTAHVMNLLRKSNPTPPQAEAAPTAAAEPVQQGTPAPAAPQSAAPTPAPAAQVPPIITALNADAEVSAQIKDALSEALAQEEAAIAAENDHVVTAHNAQEPGDVEKAQFTAPAQPSPASEHTQVPQVPEIPYEPQTEAPVQQAHESESAPSTQETGAGEESQFTAPAQFSPVSEHTQVPQTSEIPYEPQTEAPVQQIHEDEPAHSAQETGAVAESDPNEPVLINVMEYLVEEMADKYIKLFGLCTCPRCRKDVIALALNELHPQYIVMPQYEFNIQSDMYSNRYTSEITAQLLRACRVVTDNPRHTLP